MQKTNFLYEAVIHDDASTDGTAEIIREYAEKYPEIIKPYLETENQWSKHDGSLSRIMDSLTTKRKYIAFCEGDDYWTDPYKLQKQIEVMESNEHIKLSYTAFKTVNHLGENIRRRGYEANMKYSSSGDVLPKLFFRNFIQTCSVCIRTDVFVSEILSNCPSKYDYAYFLAAACAGDVFYIPDITCAYRKAQNSVTVIRNRTVNKGLWEDYKYFVKIFYDGMTKPISLWNRLIVKGNILARFISHKDEIARLLRKDPFILCLSPYALCRYMVFKIRNIYYFVMDKFNPIK